MTRQLFTLLAFLSGLAVLQAPAHASQLDELSYDVQTLADMADAKGGAVCACHYPPRKSGLSCPDSKIRGFRPRLIGVLPPSIVLGADRALE
ncbi:MAG: hypothetical protein AAGH57_12015 [Pseudomonadota bacterium]